jgi:two-component system sensor histidine kinase/response regulator
MKRILVIEDEKDVRENIIELLTAEGFTAVGAENGTRGVQLARELLPDVILCDILMPGLDGYGVLAVLNQEGLTAAIPFIFITARVTRADARKAMDLGADDYITKPFTRQELLNAIYIRTNKHKVLADKISQKTNQTRRDFAYALPSQILAPLEVILTSSEQLINDYQILEKEHITGVAGRINRSAKDLLRIIQNYMFYAELDFMQSAQPDLPEREVFTASNVIEEMAFEITKSYERVADLDCNIQEGNLSISELYLQKIVEELVDNAFKYSPRGSGVVISGKIKPDNNHYELSIIDQGEGMSNDTVAFFNNVAAVSHFSVGSLEQRIGLMLAKRLVEISGGVLRIDSMLGSGTQVDVTLPLAGVDTLEGDSPYN